MGVKIREIFPKPNLEETERIKAQKRQATSTGGKNPQLGSTWNQAEKQKENKNSEYPTPQKRKSEDISAKKPD